MPYGQRSPAASPVTSHQNAIIQLDSNKHKPTQTDNDKTLYIHWTYHPQGLLRQDIRDAYSSMLQGSLNYHRMTVAISRPCNLRNVLTRAALKPTQDWTFKGSLQSLIRDTVKDIWLILIMVTVTSPYPL
jgi:hypothetical protein